MNAIFTTCDKCGRDIPYGSAYVAIARNIEQTEYSESSKDYDIQIIDSEVILMLCGKCGNGFHYDRIKELIEEPSKKTKIVDDLLDDALNALALNVSAKSVNFKCVGTSYMLHLLIKSGNDTSVMQPGIVIDFELKHSRPFVQSKYRHVGTAIAFCSPFEILSDSESELMTDKLLQKLTYKQVDEIQAFFNLRNDELENRKDIY